MNLQIQLLEEIKSHINVLMAANIIYKKGNFPTYQFNKNRKIAHTVNSLNDTCKLCFYKF